MNTCGKTHLFLCLCCFSTLAETGGRSNIIESVVLKPFVDWTANVFAVDVRIKLQIELPPMVYEAVSENPHGVIGVSVWGQYGRVSDNSKLTRIQYRHEKGELRLHADLYQRKSDPDSGSFYGLDTTRQPLSIHQSVMIYHATVRSLLQGQPYLIVIDTNSLKDSIPGGHQVVVKFRLV